MSVKYFQFSEEEQKKVNEILINKTDQEVNNSLETLKNWIQKQSHLPQNEDDQILRKMLIINKFSVEKTKSKLEILYSGKTFLPEFFENLSPKHESIQKMMKQCIYMPFPCLTSTYERLGLLKLSSKDLQDFQAIDLIRLILLATEIRLVSDLSVGDIVIIDLIDCSLPIITKFSPRLLQNTFSYINGAYTDRIKAMHFINVPSYAYNFITFLKSFLKSKLVERVHIHKSFDSLQKHVSKKYLPKDFGGELKTITEIYGDWTQFLESYNNWFIERSKIKSNEKLRTGDITFNSELFGLQGSFQKLIID